MTEEVAGRVVKLRAEPYSWPSDHGQCDPNGGKMCSLGLAGMVSATVPSERGSGV